MDNLYSPLLPGQIRVLHLPRSHSAKSDDLVECSLYVAEMLHPIFNGVGLISWSGNRDRTVSFIALSYVWGSPEKTSFMMCNGLTMPITPTLHDALAAIRTRDFGSEYLWVDQVCINQTDAEEKAIQVPHMLQIYELASHTIAWLGDPQEKLEAVVLATTWNGADSHTEGNQQNLDVIATGADWIYSSQYFQRLWIQQEIFGSRSLTFLCGSCEFKTCLMLSPQTIYDMTKKDIEVEIPGSGGGILRRRPKKEVQSVVKRGYERLSEVMERNLEHLSCYEYFSTKENTDIVECLLRMRNIEATNPLDFVYGVLGISKFPSRPMAIADWADADDRDKFLPIDYTMDVNVLWCILSRLLLLKGGLSLLVRFKINHISEYENEESGLPSWVIDWQKAAKFFEFDLRTYLIEPDLTIRLANAWDGVRRANIGKSLTIPTWDTELLPNTEPPAAHLELYKDNLESGQDYFDQLSLCGRMVKRSSVRITEHTVEIRKKGGKLFGKWHVSLSPRHEDIAVSISALHEHSTVNGKSTRLWLLRPVVNDRFKLVACLVGIPKLAALRDDTHLSFIRAGLGCWEKPELYRLWQLNKDKLAASGVFAHVFAEPKFRCSDIESEDTIYEPTKVFVIV